MSKEGEIGLRGDGGGVVAGSEGMRKGRKENGKKGRGGTLRVQQEMDRCKTKIRSKGRR